MVFMTFELEVVNNVQKFVSYILGLVICLYTLQPK